MEKYFYSIGYHSYEDSGYVQLMHDKQFSEQEFDEMVIGLIPDLAKETKEDIENDGRKYHWHIDWDDKIQITFADLYKNVADELCEKYGFERVHYQFEFSLFGWANLNEKNSWKVEDERYLKISDIIMEELKDAKVSPVYLNRNADLREKLEEKRKFDSTDEKGKIK